LKSQSTAASQKFNIRAAGNGRGCVKTHYNSAI
jgi:hypothetical protein